LELRRRVKIRRLKQLAPRMDTSRATLRYRRGDDDADGIRVSWQGVQRGGGRRKR
jgi:hypothetical protein